MPMLLIDIIDIKKTFREDPERAKDLCQHLWEWAKAQALYEDKDLQWVTFSDSLLVSLKEDFIEKNQPILSWLISLRDKLEGTIQNQVYAILNQGLITAPSFLHEQLGITIDRNGNSNYYHIAGFGDDFANLFVAEKTSGSLHKNGNIPPERRIYIHDSLLTNNNTKIDKNSFLIEGLSGSQERFYYF